MPPTPSPPTSRSGTIFTLSQPGATAFASAIICVGPCPIGALPARSFTIEHARSEYIAGRLRWSPEGVELWVDSCKSRIASTVSTAPRAIRFPTSSTSTWLVSCRRRSRTGQTALSCPADVTGMPTSRPSQLRQISVHLTDHLARIDDLREERLTDADLAEDLFADNSSLSRSNIWLVPAIVRSVEKTPVSR